MENTLRYPILVIMSVAMLAIGLVLTVLGITLPDLERHFQTNLKIISALYLSEGITGIFGSLMASVLLKFCDYYLYMAMATFILGVGMSLVAVTNILQVAFCTLMIVGFADSLLTIGTVYATHVTFPEEPWVFHILASSLSLGAVLCPIISAPFLGQGNMSPASGASASTNLSSPSNLSLLARNTSSRNHTLEQDIISAITTLREEDRLYPVSPKAIHPVTYLYVIIGLALLPLSFVFWGCFIKARTTTPGLHLQNKNEKYSSIREKTTLYEVFFSMFFVILYGLLFSEVFVYGSFITTITVNGRLNMNLSSAAQLTSFFWLSYLTARLLFIGVSLVIKQIIIMYICLIGVIVVVLLAIVALSYSSEVFFWIASLSFSFFCGPQFPTLMAWSRQYITITPFLLGIGTSVEFIGLTVVPFIGGELIYRYGDIAILIYSLGLTVFMFIAFLLNTALAKYISGSYSSMESDVHSPKPKREE